MKCVEGASAPLFNDAQTVFTGTDAGYICPIPVNMPQVWVLTVAWLLGSPKLLRLSIPGTWSINAPHHVYPNTAVHLKITWWLLYADGEHIKCCIYSLLPPVSHPPLPNRHPLGATQKEEGRQMKSSFLRWCLTFSGLHFEVNPSSSCQTQWSFMRWQYLHSLLYGGCKENPTC